MGFHTKKADCSTCKCSPCSCPCPRCGESRYRCSCPVAEPDPRGRHRNGCDSCLCTICANLTDCPAHPGYYEPRGSCRQLIPEARKNRCSAVCQGSSGQGRERVFPLKARFVLYPHDPDRGYRILAREESHLEAAGPELCPHFVPDGPIPRTEPTIPSALALAQRRRSEW